MADKKRNNKKGSEKRLSRKPLETFDDTLNLIMAQTIASTIDAQKIEEDTQIYYPHQNKKRYQQDAYTVAQNTVDRTEFRY